MTVVRRLRPLLVLLIVPLALLSLRETSTVSACSARGGRYDPATRHCDAASFQSGEPARPLRRSQVLLGAALVALSGAGVAVYLRKRAVRERGS